jgi:16S rRNA (uracil1498-N3)-methyltransferase
MKIHRFMVVVPLSVAEGNIEDRAICHQIHSVLRLQPGEEAVLFNEAGEEADVLLTGVSPKLVNFTVLKHERDTESEIKRKVFLAAAIVKRDNFEWIVQKATEIGVSEIIPLQTQHAIKTGVQLVRLKKIAAEAAEQCGRVGIPKILEPMSFFDALKIENGAKYFFDMEGREYKKVEGDNCILFVGPEGGWSEDERRAAKEAGCKTTKLGKFVLRAETAATVASFIALNY